MTDLEPASALAERVYMLYGSARAAVLLEADRAAVREPLERRNRELETLVCDEREVILRQRDRIASLEAQLASAREEALREAIALACGGVEACEQERAKLLDEEIEHGRCTAAGDECFEQASHVAAAALALSQFKGKLEALLTSPPKSPWIPVEDELPPHGREVDALGYVTGANSVIESGLLTRHIAFKFEEEAHFRIDAVFAKFRVVVWRHLPERPAALRGQ